MKRNTLGLYIAVGLCCAAAASAVTLLAVIGALGGFENWGRVTKYNEILNVVQDYYIGQTDADALEDAALSGAVDSLDRWSYYMTAEEYDSYKSYIANRYQGVGVTVSPDESGGGFLIVSLTAGGPAERAGVLAGEVITAADGQSMAGQDAAALRAIIQADYGGFVTLTLLGEDGSLRDVQVSCEEVYDDPVRYELLADGVGYIKLENFESGCADGAKAAITALTEQGAQSLLFDVRNDPGGQVTELVALLDHLLPEGDVFIRADKAGNETVETSDADCVEMPMAVLTNAESYSAAEFFAAALREYGWAQIVGEATTGKGRSQVTIPLSDGSAVHISHNVYLTPQRVDLSETGGLTPDVEAALDEAQKTALLSGRLAPADDPQVQAALELLTK